MPDQAPKRKIGMAGLSGADIQAFGEGRLNLDDLAARAGVSKQAASRWLRRRGFGRQPSPAEAAPSVATPAPPPLYTGATSSDVPGSFLAELRGIGHDEPALKHLAGGAAIAIIARTNVLLASDQVLGASGLKAMGTALAGAVDTLARLGIINLETDDAELPGLEVMVMTKEEAAAVRAAAEADDVQVSGARSNEG